MTYMLTIDDNVALDKFCKSFPNWWYKIGVCDLTRDFDCAPQWYAKEFKYVEINNQWDNGFSCDHTGSVADAVYDVMEQIKEAILAEIP